jgi:Flp pilus assembly protein TadG
MNLSEKVLSSAGSTAIPFLSRMRSSREGGAMVEIALLLPMMMLVPTGICSLATPIFQKLQLTDAVANGGRVLAFDRGAIDPCQHATQVIYAAAPGLEKSQITLSFTLNGVRYGDGVTSCPGASGGKNANMVAGQTAIVKATYPTVIRDGVNHWNFTVSSEATEIVR